jgi:hypothetical protein
MGIKWGLMRSRAEEYRRRGIEARQQAAQAGNQHIKEAFEHVAHDWFALAEQVEWLEEHRPPDLSGPDEKPQ